MRKADSYCYGGKSAEVTSAAGLNGVIVRRLDGDLMFRVYHDENRDGFTDYEIRHDDLSVTIDKDALASCYRVGDYNVIDHSPQVLGLKKIDSETFGQYTDS